MSNPPPCHNHTQRRHRGKFVPRTSALSVDRNSSLRGILTMLWVGAFFFFATTVAQSVHQRKPVVSPEWAATLTHNAGTLVVTDALLVMSCAGVIPIALAVQRDLIPIQSARFVSGAALSAWFAAWFAHIFHQDWLWPQAFSLALHLIANLMKSYSYLATNVDFCEKKKRAEALREKFGKNCSIDDQGVERDELDSIERELVGDWSGLTFPSNITLANWMDYMLVPSLVYELDFPRLPKHRPFAFFGECFKIFVSCVFLSTAVDHHVLPIFSKTVELGFVTTVLYLTIPFAYCYMLLFYIVFEHICNAFAELTRFADREFYEDWWNSVSWDEFARRWNKPVHEFLLRHVYLDSIEHIRLPKRRALLLTFFVSSVFHELVIFMVGKRLRVWFFGFQMLQIPLMWFTRLPTVRQFKSLLQGFVWFSLFLGLPLLATMYVREYYVSGSAFYFI